MWYIFYVPLTDDDDNDVDNNYNYDDNDVMIIKLIF